MSYAALPDLRTPRLTLRPLNTSDAEVIVEGVGNYDVSRWLGSVPYPYGKKDALEFIDRVSTEALLIWAIENEHGFVGVVGLDEELGYWLARSQWRRGYGFEAARAVTEHWFSDPTNGDLVSGHYDENHRSSQVLRALGFQVTGQGPRFAASLAQEVPGTDVVLTRKRWEDRQDFTLYTPRLTIRPIEDHDAAGFAALTVPEVTRMLSNLKSHMTEAEALADFPRRKWRGYFGFTLILEYKGRVAGTIGVGQGTVGYFLARDHWGQGLMTEALSAVLPEIFERFPINTLRADHFEDNPASGVILKKFGFETTGRDTGTSKARVEPDALITYALKRDNLRVPV